MGVIVIIDEAIVNGHWMLEHFARNFDLVVANTLGCSSAISQLSGSIPPVLWWIHESEHAMHHFEAMIPHHIDKNIHIYAVAEYVRNLLSTRSINAEATIFTYGIEDYPHQEKPVPTDKFIFTIVGSVEDRKGQLVVLEAIKKLPERTLRKTKFIFVGNILDESIFKRILEAKEQYDCIEYYEPMPRSDIFELYQNSTCALIPSTDDPLPVVAPEAMIMGRACICSDHTGTAKIITDNVNGVIFKSEDSEELAEKLIWVTEHPNEMKTMGIESRKLYEREFTYNSFKKRSDMILDDLVRL
jgi:glycosyltransferase involved in cell wall biosynthesis